MTSDGYNIKISGDTVNCHLPFFGNSNTPMYGSRNISITVKNQKLKIFKQYSEKRDSYILSFKSNSSTDGGSWDFAIEIFSNGAAAVQCTSNNKSPMGYNGDLIF